MKVSGYVIGYPNPLSEVSAIMKKLIRIIFLISMLLMVVYAGVKRAISQEEANIIQSEANESQTVYFSPKNKDLEEWIDKLSEKENCPILGMVDSNGKLSYGTLCFQAETFQRQIRKYGMLPNAEWDEIMNFIGDEN